jgi:Transglycosylase-like domain
MRKTMLTITLLFGAVPAALASTGTVPPQNVTPDADAPVPDVPTPPASNKAKRDLHGSEQVVRRAVKRRKHLAKRAEGASAAPKQAGPAASVPPQLQAIAQCESGGDPSAVGGGGQFRGKYQFTYATWAAVGGSGDPAAAPEAEQDRRAAQLYASSGAGQWPVCGK